MKRALVCLAVAVVLALGGCAAGGGPAGGASNGPGGVAADGGSSGGASTAQGGGSNDGSSGGAAADGGSNDGSDGSPAGGGSNGPGGGAATGSSTSTTPSLAHRFATADEGKELLLANDAYYASFSQNDLDFKMQKTGATMDEYKAFAAEQVRDFTDDEKARIDEELSRMAGTLTERGYNLPPLDEIVFVKTTMAEECDASAYTHGTTVYLSEYLFVMWNMLDAAGKGTDYATEILWHELFHCLTRRSPGFRSDMYRIIHFTTHDKDFALPASVAEYHISNPDVEHHDASATFRIDGKDVECFCDFVTTRHFEKKGDSFFDLGTTALVPVDGTDTYYTPEQAASFDEIFGKNTDYVIDPEECLADNFAYALTYGEQGPDGEGYETPEIIKEILAYLGR